MRVHSAAGTATHRRSETATEPRVRSAGQRSNGMGHRESERPGATVPDRLARSGACTSKLTCRDECPACRWPDQTGLPPAASTNGGQAVPKGRPRLRRQEPTVSIPDTTRADSRAGQPLSGVRHCLVAVETIHRRQRTGIHDQRAPGDLEKRVPLAQWSGPCRRTNPSRTNGCHDGGSGRRNGQGPVNPGVDEPDGRSRHAWWRDGGNARNTSRSDDRRRCVEGASGLGSWDSRAWNARGAGEAGSIQSGDCVGFRRFSRADTERGCVDIGTTEWSDGARAPRDTRGVTAE